jgi:N-methylhydantoinase B
MAEPMRSNVDPFLLEILKSSFDTIADDMALNLMRTAYSGIVRDSMDFSTAILDRHGQTLAQGLTTPMHLGSFYDAMSGLARHFEGRMAPGDVYIFNDPYVAHGMHLPDIYIVKPIYFEDQLCGWACSLAHHCDVGGIVAGSNALSAHEIYQEGLRIPYVKFVDAGKPVQGIWDIVVTNVRLPDKVMGDLQSQLAACATGERELTELIRRYGLVTLVEYYDHLHDYAECLARAAFRAIPDGTYRFTDHIDGLGDEPEDVIFQLALTVDGDHVTADFDGSSPQVKGGINAPFPFIKASVYAALRSIMPEEVPNCHGYTRAITVRAPEGSVVNPVMPAACGARGITGYRTIDCMFGALAQALPDRVAADNSGGSTLPTISGWRDGKPFVFCETFMGNYGATAHHDGEEGVAHIGANQSNVPVEMIEAEYPIRIEHYGVMPDTGGPGRYRGGLSLVRSYRVLAEEADLNVRSDKRKHPPHGLYGGGVGAPSMNTVHRNSGNAEVLPVLLTRTVPMRRGDLFHHVMPGGGGYGDPLERDPALVLEDVLEEKVTRAHAADAYGVVIADGPEPSVDTFATVELRARRRRGADQANADRAG